MNRFALLLLLSALLLAGCPASRSSKRISGEAFREPLRVAPGVELRESTVHSRFGPSKLWLLSVDLTQGARLRIRHGAVHQKGGATFAQAETPRSTCEREGAAACVNGGFFGQTEGSAKEVIGLLASAGVVRSSGRLHRATGRPGVRFARSALATMANGQPLVAWLVGQRGRNAVLTAFDRAENPVSQQFVAVEAALACGPRLIRRGEKRVFDREERLISRRDAARTFVGYSISGGKTQRVAIGIAEALAYEECAEALQEHFWKTWGETCWEAMCLDGGSSSQMTVRHWQGWLHCRDTGVTVPTALLVYGGNSKPN